MLHVLQVLTSYRAIIFVMIVCSYIHNAVCSSVLLARKTLSIQATHLFGAEKDSHDNTLLGKEKASRKISN